MVLAVFSGAAWLFFAGFGLDVHVHRFHFGPRSSASGQAAQAKLDETFQAFFPDDSGKASPGFAVLVKQNGKVVFEKGYGVRDLRTKAAIDARTNFRLASFTKQFTSMAIMLLVHDGKLRYDQSLADIFPEFPAYGKTITVRNLLNQTAGVIQQVPHSDHFSGISCVRQNDHCAEPVESHRRFAGLRRFDGSGRKNKRPDLVAGKTD